MNEVKTLSSHARAQVKAARFQAWLCEKLGDRNSARDWRRVANCFIEAAHKLQEAGRE